MTSGVISRARGGAPIPGTMVAAGHGTIDGVTITGELSGTINAQEDSLAPDTSGSLTNVTVGSVSSTGTMTSGAISSVSVGGTMAGTMVAAGHGTIDGVTITGELSGTIDAQEDSLAPDTSGSLTNVTVGSVSSTGTMTSGAISSVSVGGTLAGPTAAAGHGTI